MWGYIGKLIKVSAGVENTHSRYGDGRMEQMALLTERTGHPKLAGVSCACNTTDDALALLKEQELQSQFLDRTALCVKHWMETREWRADQQWEAVNTFSTAHQLLGATENWQKAHLMPG
ncbi:MAG: hypothetical protein ACLUD2_13025 [Clostridium sp.]